MGAKPNNTSFLVLLLLYATPPRICLCASIYLIMAVGVERYLAVCRPHHYREVQARTNRSTTYISLALGAAVTVCLPRFAEVTPVRNLSFYYCKCIHNYSSKYPKW